MASLRKISKSSSIILNYLDAVLFNYLIFSLNRNKISIDLTNKLIIIVIDGSSMTEANFVVSIECQIQFNISQICLYSVQFLN